MAVPPELQKSAAISFGKTSAEFSPGDVVDGKVRFTFPFENTGDALLVIRGIRHSCGCISVEEPTKRLKPGEASELVVTVDERAGIVRVSVTGRADTESFRGHVVVHADAGVPAKLSIPFTCYVTGSQFR